MNMSFIIAGIGNSIAKALAAGGAETIALRRTQKDFDKLKVRRSIFSVNQYVVCHY